MRREEKAFSDNVLKSGVGLFQGTQNIVFGYISLRLLKLPSECYLNVPYNSGNLELCSVPFHVNEI